MVFWNIFSIERKTKMELIKAISESGILIVIAGVFLYTYLSDKKEMKSQSKKWVNKTRKE